MKPTESYIDQCINALPPERREAARLAFKEISEDGKGTFLDKFLVLLDASGAYAKTIPLELKSIADALIREIESIRSQDAAQRASEAEQREKQLCQIITEQLPVLAKGLAVTRLAEGIEAQNVILGRLTYNVSAMRYFRVWGVLLLTGLGSVIGAATLAGVFYKPYKEGQQASTWWNYFSQHGIQLTASESNDAVTLTVDADHPVLSGTTLRKNEQGRITGIDLIYPK